MKKTKLKFTKLIAVVAVLLTMVPVPASAAGTATLYTNPAGTQPVAQGSNFSIQVRINASVAPGAAEVSMAYSADKLQVQSVNYSGSQYDFALLESNSGGVLQMDRAAFSAVPAGDQLFATVTLKAIAAGSANINFTDASVVRDYSDGSAMALSKNGVAYNVAANPTPADPTSPTPSSGSSPTTTTPNSRGNRTAPAPQAPSQGTPSNSPEQTTNPMTNPTEPPANSVTGQTANSQVINRDKNPKLQIFALSALGIILLIVLVMFGRSPISRFMLSKQVGKSAMKSSHDPLGILSGAKVPPATSKGLNSQGMTLDEIEKRFGNTKK